MNSMRFIKIELCGIRRLSTNPATKAPMMCSTPATSARKAAKKTTESTKIYCEDFSLSNLLKNHFATLGIIKNIIKEWVFIPNWSPNFISYWKTSAITMPDPLKLFLKNELGIII